MRVFLDTNVVVSAVGTRGLCADVFQAVLAEHDLVVGQTVLAELHRVFPEKMRLSLDLTRELDVFLRQEGDVVTARVRIPAQSVHGFRSNPSTHSGARRPPIPVMSSCHSGTFRPPQS